MPCRIHLNVSNAPWILVRKKNWAMLSDGKKSLTYALSGVAGSNLMLRNSIGTVVLIGFSAENLPSNRFAGFMDKPLSAKVSFATIYTSNHARPLKRLRRIVSSME